VLERGGVRERREKRGNNCTGVKYPRADIREMANIRNTETLCTTMEYGLYTEKAEGQTH